MTLDRYRSQHQPNLPQVERPVPKLDFSARFTKPGLVREPTLTGRTLATRSSPELVGDIRVKSDNVRFGSKADNGA